MEALFEKKGRLSVVVTRGWISGQEAVRLAPGSILVGDSLAGAGAELLFEGRYAARGEIAILGPSGRQIVAFRIADLERAAREDSDPDRGDELAELLPFEVEFGQARYSLAELQGAGPGTVISLDTRYEATSPATLRVAGIPVGEGRVVALGERLGIRLDASALRSTEAFVTDPEEAARAKSYDWTKPDRFTKTALLGLEALHETALSRLKSRFPELAEYRIDHYDQLAWVELANDEKMRGSSILRASMRRPRREYERERFRAAPARAFIQPESPSLDPEPGTEEAIGRWLEEERARADDRPLFVFASGDAVAALGDERAFLDCLGSGWSRVSDYAFAEPGRLEKAPVLSIEGDKVSGDGRGLFGDEMIAVVGLRGPGGALLLAYSARAVNPVAETLSRYGRLRMPG